MSPLQAAINAKATPNQRAAFAAQDWCRQNPGWLPICDIQGTDHEAKVVLRWSDITQDEQNQWIERHDNETDARLAWEEFGRVGRYKVPAGFIDETGHFLTLIEWRTGDLAGRGFMMVFNLGTINHE